MSPPAPPATDEFLPATQSELSRFVAENARQESPLPLSPVGGRTTLHFGYSPDREPAVIATSKLARIVDYPARDMTITVEAGIRMDLLAAELKKERQRLPVDVAQSHRATLGGVVATNTSGPRRFGQGTIRDYVIGISAVDAEGRLFNAGGRVVKNVAGYDLCKLLVGSLGTLAVVTQVTLKLRPLPETSALVWASFHSFADVDQVLGSLLTSQTRPVALEVLDPRAVRQIATESRVELPAAGPLLCVGFEGTETETNWQVETLKQELRPYAPLETGVVKSDKAQPLWNALTEFQIRSDEPLTFRASLLPSRTMEFVNRAAAAGVSVQAHAGNGVVIGHLPDEAATPERAAGIITPLRKFAADNRGNLVIFYCNEEWKQHLPLFGDPEPSWPLMRKIKQQLDPQNILNPGRFIV